MKTKKIISVLLVALIAIGFIFTFTGCNEKKFDNSLPCKTALVSVDYSDKVNKKSKLVVGNDSEEFDVTGLYFYNKVNNKKVKHLYGGDRLQIYYSDNNLKVVDHVLVEKAEVLVLELLSAVAPGSSNGKSLYSEKLDVAVNNTEYGAYWVMDKSGSYIPLDDIDDNTTLYGTYIKEEIEITSETPYITKLHYIHALYLYNPNK